MFGLLKKKLADWLGNSSKKDEEKQPEIVVEKVVDKPLEDMDVEPAKPSINKKEKKFDKKITEQT